MTVLHAEPFNRLTYSYAGTTSTLFVSYCISDSACSKSYKAKGSTCVSIFNQWLLWSGSRPVIVQTYNVDSKKLPVMHGYVEDMELSDTTQVTGDH